MLWIVVSGGLLLSLGGCSEPAAPEKAPVAAVAPPARPATAPNPAVDKTADILAPSPLQLEKQVREAGVADSLADLVPKSPGALSEGSDKDRVAIHTGVALAHVVLAGRTLPKADFVAQLRLVRSGMASLGAGAGLMSTIDDMLVQVENDTASREDFLKELDGVAGYAVPEQGWGRGDRTGPLLQAGAWVAGTNLVAQAIVRSGKGEAAEKLLRRPEVPGYFLGYVQAGGAQKAGPFAEDLKGTLEKLKEISGRATLGIGDAQEMADTTGKLLKQLGG